MFNNRCYDRDNEMSATFTGNNNTITNEMEINEITDINTPAMPMDDNMMGCTAQSPIIEPMKERCIQRDIVHEVPHICPMRTKIINHHIYKHTYRPAYSCCEENVVSNVQCGYCSQFNN